MADGRLLYCTLISIPVFLELHKRVLHGLALFVKAANLLQSCLTTSNISLLFSNRLTVKAFNALSLNCSSILHRNSSKRILGAIVFSLDQFCAILFRHHLIYSLLLLSYIIRFLASACFSSSLAAFLCCARFTCIRCHYY